MQTIPVILAGGLGTRLWPLSTPAMPKQFVLRDANGLSLFQASIARVADRSRFTAPLVVAQDVHRFLVLDQLRAIGCVDAEIILEPKPCSTAPALALASAYLQKKSPEAPMLVLPADHRIDMPSQLLEAVETALPAAMAGHIVTFAIAPESPETAYGYIRYGEPLEGINGLRRIAQFIEKPDAATASALINAGGHGWNSGMFLMRAAVAQEALRQHVPTIHHPCHAAMANHQRDGHFLRPDAATLAPCPAIAFDVAVMEHTEKGVVIEVSMGWRDLGTWRGLEAAHADSPLLTPSSVEAATTFRPWGHFSTIDQGDGYQVKKLTLRAGQKISLQCHQHRAEHWVVVQGTATVTHGSTRHLLQQNESCYIAAGETHCLENTTPADLIVIEVQTGDYLGEDDIKRFD